MSVTSVYLLRHGETTWNAERRFQGTQNSPLSARGRHQVARLVEALRDVPVTAVYSSPLLRAQETARAVATAHDVVPAVVDDLRELEMGEWENRLLDDLALEDGARMQAWRDAPHTVRMPRGESLSDVQDRALRAFWDLAARHQGRAIVLLAHGGVNKTILLALLGAPLASYWRIRQSNACINLVEVDGAQPRVIALNETVHLGADA
jgi:broad specificity phosphatase PhoE